MSKVDYNILTEHYTEMLELFDVVHFSGSVSESVYNQHVKIKHSERISISNKSVADNRCERLYNLAKLQLLFIGNTSSYKGLPMLEQVLAELYDEGYRAWELNVWGAVGDSKCELIRFNGSYTTSEVANIFEKDQLLITPSLCYETFSLATLEALSYGVPALVSSTVGAKDIVGQYDPWFVFSDRVELKSKLLELLGGQQRLRAFNRLIMEGEWRHSLSSHVKDINRLYIDE